MLHQIAPHEDGISAQRRHAQALEKVQRRLEPEKVLQHIEKAEPSGIMIHQLDAALHHIHTFIQHDRIDDIQYFGMRFVLGIEDRHHIAARRLAAPDSAHAAC